MYLLKNRPVLRAVSTCVIFLSLGVANLHAAAFIKIGDIKGEATDNEHKDWIIIESMSSPLFRSVQLDTTTGQRATDPLRIGDISCVKELDKSSPKLAESVANGTFYDEVEIHFARTVDDGGGTGPPREEPYLTYKLKDVIITSYSFHGNAAGDPLPTEEVTLGYTEVEWTYIVLDPKTSTPIESVTGSWSVRPPG